MKRGRLPLTALRSFEAAGRLESFTLAAEELFVSQAAISRQVRELEALLGKPLFTRHHRQVRLSAEGARLLETLAAAFDSIDERLEDIRGRSSASVLTISAEPGFAGCWLVPHLADFRARRPQIDVSVEADTKLIEFRGNAAPLAIRHSAQSTAWPRTQARHLCDVHLVPVVSPTLLQEGSPLATPKDLLSHTLLHEENRDVWTRWFAAVDFSPPAEALRGPIYTDSALTLQAVLRGHGVALVDSLFVQEDIASGRLIQPFDIAIPLGAYWLVTRDFGRLSPEAQAFADWMEGCFAGVG